MLWPAPFRAEEGRYLTGGHLESIPFSAFAPFLIPFMARQGRACRPSSAPALAQRVEGHRTV